MANIVEITDDRHVDAPRHQLFLNMGNRLRRLFPIDRDADDLRAGPMQILDLQGRRMGIGRVGVGHRLHHDRRITAHRHMADLDRDTFPPFERMTN